MRVSLTGTFGNVGRSTLDELINQDHQVTCFDIWTEENEKAAQEYGGRAKFIWGDLRHREEVARAVADQEAIVHVAFILPATSSHTGISSEDQPDYAREVNVGGTRNLIEAAKALAGPSKFIFCSTQNLFGRTQDQPPPRTVSDPVVATSHYTAHKIECQEMVKASGLEWVILRLCAVWPIRVSLDPSMFDVPPSNRMEFVHTRDVGIACVNALGSDEAVGKILLIGGGPNCQSRYGDFVGQAMGLFGMPMPADESFATLDSCHDWVDTTESQRLLSFQRRTFDDYLEDMRRLISGSASSETEPQ
jgi:nucleoside-diphosphate-sugar epimerase